MLWLDALRSPDHSAKLEIHCLKNFHESLSPTIRASIAIASLGLQPSSSELKISDATIDPNTKQSQKIFSSIMKKN